MPDPLPQFPTIPAGAPVGIIAGMGSLPVAVARGLQALGHPVIGAAFHNHAHADFPAQCRSFREVGLLRPGQWIRYLRKHGARHTLVVGKVQKEIMYERFPFFRFIPDWRFIRIYYRKARDHRTDSLMRSALASELSSAGITMVGVKDYVPELLASDGVMGKIIPSKRIQADIEFAWPLLQRINELLIGQCLACHDLEIIAVEAVEGTDRMIERAGQLCKRGGWILCKASNPQQDDRIDLPAVGIQTIENMKKAGGEALILEAGRTLMVEKEKLLQRANELNIAVIGRPAHAVRMALAPHLPESSNSL